MNSEEHAPEETPEEETPEESTPEDLRLHPSSMLFEAIAQARSLIGAAVIPGVALLFGSGLSAWVISLVITGAIVLVVVSAAWGIISWRATTYAVRGGAFYLKSGVLQKNERTIPLDHVQSVDTVQGFLQRGLSAAGLLDVVEVRIETAGGGSATTDAVLSSVLRRDSEGLRREIERSRRKTPGAESDTEEEPRPQTIRTLSVRELLIAGATSGQIGATAAILAFASQFFDNAIERFFSERFVNSVVQTLAPHVAVAVALVVFAFGLVAWLLSIAGTVLSYYGFTLSRSPDGKYLNIRRGLVKRYEATVPIKRVQAVRVSEGIFRQPFGLAMLRVESAGYGGGEDSGVSTTLFPLIPTKEIPQLLGEILPEFAVSAPLRPPPRRALRRYILRSAYPALFLIAAALVPVYFTNLVPVYIYAIASAGLLAASALYGRAAFLAAGWAISGDCFISRHRNLSRTTAIAPRRRLQSRSVVRSPFQRRLDLATIRTRVASGSGGATFEVVDIEWDEARTILPKLGTSLI